MVYYNLAKLAQAKLWLNWETHEFTNNYNILLNQLTLYISTYTEENDEAEES